MAIKTAEQVDTLERIYSQLDRLYFLDQKNQLLVDNIYQDLIKLFNLMQETLNER